MNEQNARYLVARLPTTSNPSGFPWSRFSGIMGDEH